MIPCRHPRMNRRVLEDRTMCGACLQEIDATQIRRGRNNRKRGNSPATRNRALWTIRDEIEWLRQHPDMCPFCRKLVAPSQRVGLYHQKCSDEINDIMRRTR